MSDPLTPHAPPRLWRRVAIALAGLVGLIAVLGVIGDRYDHARTTGALKTLTDRLDRDDPNWRLADIEANREVISDNENSAFVIAKRVEAIPVSEVGIPWLPHHALPPPNQLPDPALLEELKQVTPLATLPELRRLADLPRGRFPLSFDFNPLDTKSAPSAVAGMVSHLLQYDHLFLTSKGDTDKAMRSARAMINLGRATGDEPLIRSQMLRAEMMVAACEMIERTLGHGEASAKELAAVQHLLEREEQHPTSRIALRGERAMHHDLFAKIAAGKLNGQQIRRDQAAKVFTWWEEWFAGRIGTREHHTTLTLMTRLVDSTNLPETERADEESRIEDEIGRLGRDSLPYLLLQSIVYLNGVHFHTKSAAVRTLLTAVAVERYRVELRRWPASLEDLTPRWLKAVPLDPFDGKPLRYAKTAEGVVVYSIGRDATDGGGKVWPRPASDLGYHLWNVDKRRQPARPKAPEGGDNPP